MSGSLTRADGENVPGIPGACAPTSLRIWQETHCVTLAVMHYMTVCDVIRRTQIEHLRRNDKNTAV